MTVRSIVRRVLRWVVSGEVLAAPRSQEGVEEGGGVRGLGGGGGLYLTLHCHHHRNNFCVQMGSDGSMIARAPLKCNCHYIRNILPEPDSAQTLQKSLAEIIIIPRSSVRIRMQADQTWTQWWRIMTYKKLSIIIYFLYHFLLLCCFTSTETRRPIRDRKTCILHPVLY